MKKVKSTSNKPKYMSKAEREKMALEAESLQEPDPQEPLGVS